MDDFSYTPPAAGKASLKDRILGMDKKMLAIIGGGLALIIVVAILLAVLLGGSGGKTSPISVLEKYANKDTIKFTTYIDDVTGAIGGNGISKIIKILSKNEDVAEELADFEESFAENMERLRDEYGDNYKIRYKNDPDSEDELDKDDLKSFENRLESLGKEYIDYAKDLSKMKNSEKKDLAEELGISVSDLNKIADCLKDVGTKLKSAKVTEGYYLEFDITITGSELDEPEEDESSISVFKVNGKWVSNIAYYWYDELLDLLDDYLD